MLEPSTSPFTWDSFVDAVAAAVHVQPAAISRSSRLDDELGIDSLALAELVVVLIVDLGMDTLAQDFDEREWAGITVGALYDEYLARRLDDA